MGISSLTEEKFLKNVVSTYSIKVLVLSNPTILSGLSSYNNTFEYNLDLIFSIVVELKVFETSILKTWIKFISDCR